ncbi:hypothetical protein CYMTET_39299 [Cymbomonas tetramitiformis]|uniref:HAT C-terminal dimerisation domain-containing protein n=1 Tax=Cymbomonas tetramitiformis TaxID=36881 RepID=A0AAE0CBI5_9CHLO|nr:hypothetical protein CYMTET_39299 [Cymbomonas tetramitiformis]
MADSDDEDEVPSLEPGIVVEFNSYLAYPDAPADTEVLSWWKAHGGKLPVMSKMARQFLAVPAFTAGVERAFSRVSFMHSDLRKNLSKGTIQHSVMAAMN